MIDQGIIKEDGFTKSDLLAKIVFVFAAVFVFVVSRYAFIFFLAGMLPSILVMFWDIKNHHKCASATVLCFNFIGILPYLFEMWNGSSISESAKIMIGDLKSWLYIYAFALIGYVFYIIVPLVISRLFMMKFEFRKQELVDRRAEICDDWEIDVSEFEKDKH